MLIRIIYFQIEFERHIFVLLLATKNLTSNVIENFYYWKYSKQYLFMNGISCLDALQMFEGVRRLEYREQEHLSIIKCSKGAMK